MATYLCVWGVMCTLDTIYFTKECWKKSTTNQPGYCKFWINLVCIFTSLPCNFHSLHFINWTVYIIWHVILFWWNWNFPGFFILLSIQNIMFHIFKFNVNFTYDIWKGGSGRVVTKIKTWFSFFTQILISNIIYMICKTIDTEFSKFTFYKKNRLKANLYIIFNNKI